MVKKKLLACMLVMSVLLSTVLICSHAGEIDSSAEGQIVSVAELEQYEPAPLSDFSYRLEHGSIYITGYYGDDAILRISESYIVNGKERRVKGIDKSAFEANETLIKVILPMTIETIGDYAFYDCTSLAEVAILSDTVTIGEQAFGYYYVSSFADGKVEDFRLIAHEGSTAQEYLSKNGLNFVELEINYKIGDIDGNGEITSVDLVILIQHLLGIHTLSGDPYKMADINNDNKIDIVDLVRLKKVIAEYGESGDTPVVKKYTVTFFDWDGTVLKIQTVSEGESVIPPSDPIRDGYTFNGWSGSYVNLTANTTITATYVKESAAKYTVTFYDYDGTTVLKTQEVTEGKNATPPANPTKSGAAFLGWNGNYLNVTKNETAKAVYSDEKNVFVVESVSGGVGNTVTVLISIDGRVKTCGFDINVLYDSNLQLVSYDDDMDLDIVVNTNAFESGMKLNFSSASDKTKQRDIIELTFQIKNTTKTSLPISVSVNSIKEISGNNPTDTTYTVVGGIVKVN